MEPCRYGAACYRRNPEHLGRFSHLASSPKRAKPLPPALAVVSSVSSLSVSSIRLGSQGPWQYRSSGTTRYQKLDYDEELPEACELALQALPLRLSHIVDPSALASLAAALHHGDVLDVGDYRGCGCFVVEPTTAECCDFYLHKTLEEMGYGVPIYFSDAPVGYFEGTELYYRFRHVDYVSNVRDELWAEVELRQRQPSYEPTSDWHEGGEVQLKKFPQQYVHFSDSMNGGSCWLTLAAYSAQEYVRSDLEAFRRNRMVGRREWRERQTRVLCVALLRHVGLGRDVSGLVAGWVCARPFPFLSPLSSPGPRQVKMRKRATSDDDDDDEWSP